MELLEAYVKTDVKKAGEEGDCMEEEVAELDGGEKLQAAPHP